MGKKTSTKKKRATKAAAPAKKQKEEDKIEIEAKQAEEEDDAEPEDEDRGEEAEEEDDEEDVGAAPRRKNKARRLQKAMEKDSDEEDAEPRGVIYIGHIPDGFFEPQMKKFFNQFGRVTRLRISRSKKRAASKGYGWVEFEEESVAKIVAETMHKYLMFGKQLVCNLVPKEKQWPGLFKGWKRRMANLQPARRKKEREFMNNRPTVLVNGETLPQVTIRQVERRKKSDKKLADLLKRLEVDYDISLVDPESEAHTSSLADPEGEGGVGQLLLDLSGAGGQAPKGGKKRKGAAAAAEATTAAEAPKPKVAKKKGRKAA